MDEALWTNPRKLPEILFVDVDILQGGVQPDYAAQWAQYYRSQVDLKHKGLIKRHIGRAWHERPR